MHAVTHCSDPEPIQSTFDAVAATTLHPALHTNDAVATVRFLHRSALPNLLLSVLDFDRVCKHASQPVQALVYNPFALGARSHVTDNYAAKPPASLNRGF